MAQFKISLVLLVSLVRAALPTGCSVPVGAVMERNFYALFCRTVQIDGTVRGDLIAFGGEVIIGNSGRVEGSILAAGVKIQVNGAVGDSIRTVSNELLITKSANLTGQMSDISAFALIFRSDAALPGDVWLAGRDVLFTAPIHGEKYVTLLPPSLPLTFSKRIADWLWGTAQGWLGMITLGLLALLNVRPALDRIVGKLQARPLQALRQGEVIFWGGVIAFIPAILIGVGLVGALAVVSLGGLVMVAGIGIAGIFVSVICGMVLLFGMIGPLIAAIGIGRWYQHRLVNLPKGQAEFIGLLFGAFVVAILGNLPFVGIILAQGLAALGVGALSIYWRDRGMRV